MQDTLNQLRTLLRGVWNYRWSGLITALIIGLLGGIGALLWPNKYEATARVYVDTESILLTAIKDVSVTPNTAEQMNMVARTLISRPNVERVMLAAQLNLQVTDPVKREALIDELTKEIEFKAIGGPNASASNNLFTISYKHRKKETAQTVVQTLVGLFVEMSLQGIRTKASSAQRFLDSEIKEYQDRLIESENALKDFKIKNMGMIPAEGGRDYVARLQDEENQIRMARLELNQAENARESVRRQLSGESPTLGNSEESTTIINPLGQRMRTDLEDRLLDAEKRLDELRSRLTEEHPDVVSARRTVESLRAQRERERVETKGAGTTTTTRAPVANPVYRDLRNQLSQADADVASKRAKLADFENRYKQTRELAGKVPAVEAELTQLTRDYEALRVKYQKLLESREAITTSSRTTGSTGVGEIRIIDPARVNPKPASPNRFLLLLGSLILSLGAGIGMALFKDQSKPTFFDVRSLRSFTGMPLLGGVSFVMSPAGKVAVRRDFWLFTAGLGLLLGAYLIALAIAAIRQFGS